VVIKRHVLHSYWPIRWAPREAAQTLTHQRGKIRCRETLPMVWDKLEEAGGLRQWQRN